MNKELKESKERLYEFIHNINLADKTIDNIKQDVYTVLNYIDNSISKEVIEKKIDEIEKRIEKYREYIEQRIETDTEWVDNVADRQIVQVLQELLEGK